MAEPTAHILIIDRGAPERAQPLLADGIAAALRAVPGWTVAVAIEGVGTAGPDEAAPELTLEISGDQLWLRGTAAPGTPAAMGALGAAAPAAKLRAAVAAVLAGLSVREGEGAAPWGLVGIDDSAHEPLTPRELEVFELLGKGLSNREIAGLLGISAHTAKFHVGQILAKVGAATRAEAVGIGLKLGLIGL